MALKLKRPVEEAPKRAKKKATGAIVFITLFSLLETLKASFKSPQSYKCVKTGNTNSAIS